MLRLPALAGALALACILPVTVAQAKQGTYQHIGSTKSMSLTQVIQAQRSLIAFDHRVIRGWQESRWVKVTAHVSYATPAALAKPAPPAVRYARAQLRWVKRELRENLRILGRPAGFPPHHLLWLCISRYEGGPTSVNPNGHYGMLQMTYNWFGYIKGRASDYPQAVQEWAAERAYAANHYSSSFLYGQWFNWDRAAGECMRFA